MDTMCYSSPNGTKYILGDEIGSGGQADVYMATIKDSKDSKEKDTKGVMKCFSYREYYETEVEALKNIKPHKGIVKMYDHFALPKKGLYQFFIFLEYIEGKTLNELQCSKELPEEEVKNYIRQIITILEHIHSCEYIYVDLKPENLIVHPKRGLVFIDFGMASKIGGFFNCALGTIDYLSPESIGRIVSGQKFMLAAPSRDVWTVGVIFYELITGKYMFGNDIEQSETNYQKKVTSLITSMDYKKLETPYEAAQKFLEKFIQKDEDLRPSLKGILKHPYLNPL